MVKPQTSFRLSKRCIEQISEIATATGENKTEVVARAVDDLFRREATIDQESARLGFAVRGLVDAANAVQAKPGKAAMEGLAAAASEVDALLSSKAHRSE